MQTKPLVSVITALFLAIALCACTTADSLCPLDDYVSGYNSMAEEFGFSKINLSISESGICGFAAFDGLFIVCLCTDTDGRIYSADISTGSKYSDSISASEDELERACLSASYLITPLYSRNKATEEDISTLAGMVLACLDGERIKIAKNTYLTGRHTSSGGFELTVSLVG